MRRAVWFCAVALFVLPASHAWGQAGPSEALLQDAAAYAAETGVNVEEAVRRLQLQREAGALEAALSESERATFAGLWIEHEPVYRVVVRFTDRASEERLRSRIAGTGLSGLVELRRAEVSLAELEERRGNARQLARQLRFPVDTDINVKENRAEIFSDRPQALGTAIAAARANLPDRVEVIGVAELAQPAVLIGGTSGSTCTGGFTVRGYSGELGISTAAHCGNSQAFNGISLPFRAEDQQGNQDVQWHSACKLDDVSNEFVTGIGNRSCTGTQHRDYQAIGSYVCKWGMTTGRTCGYIQSKSISVSYVTSSAATFVRVDGGVVQPGDSGGPWFVENVAYGITSGYFTADWDGIYMPINYISSIGASVLTYNPGPGCNLPPVASFTHSTFGGNWVDFDASSSYDPDGSIVSYSWDFGDGQYTTLSSPWASNYYYNNGGYYVTLTVTDDQGAVGYGGGYVSVCPQSNPWEPQYFCPVY
jgi:hypothetical protein